MGTRSAIGYTLPTGEVRGIYCHWDGSIESNGRILQENYQEARKIGQMVELGNMSSLGAELADSTYYGRDRGETGVDATQFDGIGEFVTEMAYSDCEYMYVWNGTEWIVTQADLVFDRVEDKLAAIAA